jgi:hypothetical protein
MLCQRSKAIESTARTVNLLVTQGSGFDSLPEHNHVRKFG